MVEAGNPFGGEKGADNLDCLLNLDIPANELLSRHQCGHSRPARPGRSGAEQVLPAVAAPLGRLVQYTLVY